ncbi:Peptidyl-tRNA hydrolase [Candidatus Johnevansia muelleri]|uniref:Peptidyl-tRNA hydrolase n=1 Tax=Candidatus Johnevansia muelleri TaxID=1495769 RepID=A0A078KEH7_9GAMM|nr:Peptidyl-tRNA hydrolase [Candidatus Evansia muelleri]
MNTTISAIIGLRNYGNKYIGTRHNVGAKFVYKLANLLGIKLYPKYKYLCEYARISLSNKELDLFVPLTYMNNNGKVLYLLTKFYNFKKNFLIAHDDLDISIGKTKLKLNGGHGGHNGLRDIIYTLGTKNFPRIRIGIGHPSKNELISNYVLSIPNKNDKIYINISIKKAIDILPLVIQGYWEKAMTHLHTINK